MNKVSPTNVEIDLAVSTKQKLHPSPIVRSKSDIDLVDLSKFDHHVRSCSKSSNHHEESLSASSVLLAADTEHFGGDLVTQEHTSRERVFLSCSGFSTIKI